LPPDTTAAGQINAIDAMTAPSATRRVLRLIVGSTLLAVDSAGSALQKFANTEIPDGATSTGSLPPPSPRHVLIGALAIGPAWLNQKMQRLARRGRALASGVQRAPAPLRFAARLLPTDEIRRWSNAVRSRAITIGLSLAEVGRREEPIARRLARAATAAGLTSVFDHIASNPQLRLLIREQSAGMGRSALNDLRVRSARADAIAESVVGHLVPHPRRKQSDGSGSR